jgi:hypothetical protein
MFDLKRIIRMATAPVFKRQTAEQPGSLRRLYWNEFCKVLPAPLLALVSALVILRVIHGWLIIPVVTAQVLVLVAIIYYWLPISETH